MPSNQRKSFRGRLWRVCALTPSPILTREGIMEHGTCDFCSAQPVYAVYPCAEFIEPTLGRTVNRVWIACRTCYEFIQADQWDLLVERAFQQACATGKIGPMNPEYSCSVFRQCYANFREHRTGPPKLIGLPSC
jgi:hypothetical protein